MIRRLLTTLLLLFGAWVAAAQEEAAACANPNAATVEGKSQVVDRLLEALLPLAEGLEGAELDALIQELKQRGGSNNNTTDDNIDNSDAPLPDDEKSWEDYKDARAWGDRFVRSIEAIINDPECMDDNYSLDVTSPEFDVDDVIRIFDKCRVLVLRNFFPKKELTEYKKKITSYLMGISTGRISEQGTTSLSGEPYYFKENGKSRYDICFTPDMLNEQIMADDLLLEILTDEFMLDSNLQMLDFGVILASPGAPLQDWHRDMGDYIFAQSLATSGVAGHDLPPFAIAVITPLLDVKPEHGPTEFCLGTSQLVGIDYTDLADIPLKDESLRDILNEYSFYQCKDDSGIAYEGCPPAAWRAPLLNFGDLLLFDYNMVHRGGPNVSNNTRTMIYNTYVRSWYKDPNFSEPHNTLHAKEDDTNYAAPLSEDLKQLIQNVRFAIPDEVKVEDEEAKAANAKFDTLENVKEFRPSHFDQIHDIPEAGEWYDFFITNVDVEIEGLQVCCPSDSKECCELELGEGCTLEAEIGMSYAYKDGKGAVLKERKVLPGQKQVILSKSNFDHI